jgi:hypothetical protein
MSKGWRKFVLALVLPLMASAAYGSAFSGGNPQPGQLTFSGFDGGLYAPATLNGPYPNVNAGQFYGYFDTDGDGSYEADDFFRFFCIDIFHTASGGPNPYTRYAGLPATLSTLQQEEVTWLFDDFYPHKTTGTYFNGGVTDFGQFTDADAAAAFQLALWDIFFDGSVVSSPALATAQGYLAQINSDIGSGKPLPVGWAFYTFNSDSYQTYLSAEYSLALQEAPEPGSLVLLCVAVLAAWTAAMRRRQTA